MPTEPEALFALSSAVRLVVTDPTLDAPEVTPERSSVVRGRTPPTPAVAVTDESEASKTKTLPADAVAVFPLIDVVLVLPGEVTEPVALFPLISSLRVVSTVPGVPEALFPDACLDVSTPRALTDPVAEAGASVIAALGKT